MVSRANPPLSLLVGLLAGSVGLGGCASEVGALSASTSPEHASVVQATSSDDEIGEVYRARCGKCHIRVEPGTRPRTTLTDALVHHRNRVHLSEAEWAALINYLAASG